MKRLWKLGTHTVLGTENGPVHPPSKYEIKGRRIVGMSPIHLPDICVRCGNEDKLGKRMDDTLYWSSPLWWLLVFFFNILAVAFIYLILRKKVNVSYFLCDECRAQLDKRKNINCAVWLVIIASFAAAALLGSITPWIVFFSLCVVGIITWAVSRYPIDVDEYKDGNFYLRGFSRSYIDKVRYLTSV